MTRRPSELKILKGKSKMPAQASARSTGDGYGGKSKIPAQASARSTGDGREGKSKVAAHASAQSTGDGHGESAKHPRKHTKRKQRVQSSVIIQSQDDGGDEVVWMVSPTAQRLQLGGEGRSVLQPCQTFHKRSESVHEILSKSSASDASNSSKKKKSPGMAGKLEMWLSSSQQGHANKPTAGVHGKVELQDDDKENCPDAEALNHAEPKKGNPPSNSKARASTSKRPPSSARRRSLSAQKNASSRVSKVASKQPGERRKALLDLLDKVDNALVVKGPTLVQSRLSFNRKVASGAEQNKCHATEMRAPAEVQDIHSGTVPPSLCQTPSAHTIKETGCHDSSAERSPHEQNVQRGGGDYDPQVLPQVQILDIRSESKDLVQLPPLQRDLENLEDVHIGAKPLDHISPEPGPKVLQNVVRIQFLVLEVAYGEYKDYSNLLYPQKMLSLLDEENGAERVAHLRDSWVHAVVKPGDTVNVIGEFDADGKCVIDREHNLMVINPDLLVSGSKVGSSFSCPRRAVLEERIKSNEVSYPALMGTMLHQLFQVALRSQCPTSRLLDDEAKLIVQRQLDGLYATGVSEREAWVKLVAAIPTILSWWQHYVGVKETAAQEVEFGRIHGSQPVCVSEVVDIEEMVWSPKYGLKGMIDASISVKMGNMNLGGEDQIMPLELKTGKATTGQAATEHRAQVILYTLLMSDRYMKTVGAGLLYYLHTNQTQGVEVQHAELAGLMMRRNEYASNLLKASSDQSLPPMLQSYHMCQNCRQLDTCTIYHKAQERGTGETSGLGELFDRSTKHLSNTHIQFLRQWDRLIDLEAQDVLVSHSEIWRMPSRIREEQGRCISSLVLDISANNYDGHKISENAFTYCFRKANSSADITNPAADVSQSSQTSLQDRPFSCGDYVVLSTESGHPGVAGGTIINISGNSIVLRLPQRLRIPGKLQSPRNCSQELWRIDKDETASSLAIMRFNLLQLFVKTNGDAERRSLIVDLQAPKFEGRPVADADPAALYLRSVKDLNNDQIRAVHKIIAARDYALILGMPGTGKTSTIVHAVIALLARKASVLLTSYTNSAVDNILLRLKKLGVDFIRVGRTEAIHPELREKVLGGGMAVTSVKEFQTVVENAQVVGVTCLGINHALFCKRKFDMCIVDEAGQMTLPVCLGPLRCARSFVLVGDHYQLPPLVKSPEARDEGMAVSLFRRLSEAHPQSTSVLQSQYRMCSGIMALSNSLIYSDRLCCGSPLVANASLHVHELPNNLPPWLLQVVNPMQRLLFLDTDHLSAEESRMRNRIKNTTEASILLRIVQVLYDGGVDICKIGVISPYNAQVEHIQQAATKSGFSDLEVHTVDKYQGREKDCVLISFVRSNGQHQVSGSLLADWRRINVAITRAKTKLLMVGSRKTLSSAPILKLLIEKVDEVGCLLKLPQNANINPAR